MKKHWTAKLASELFPKKVIDESAETTNEIAAKIGFARETARTWAIKQSEAGKLERVWKHSGTNLVPAYRIKK